MFAHASINLQCVANVSEYLMGMICMLSFFELCRHLLKVMICIRNTYTQNAIIINDRIIIYHSFCLLRSVCLCVCVSQNARKILDIIHHDEDHARVHIRHGILGHLNWWNLIYLVRSTHESICCENRWIYFSIYKYKCNMHTRNAKHYKFMVLLSPSLSVSG